MTFEPGLDSEKRFAELQRVADGMNWALTCDVHSIETALAEAIPIIRRDFRGIENLMHGRIGVTEVKILDVFVRTRVRRGVLYPWVRALRTAVYIRSEELKLPPFTIRHNPGWTRLNLGINFPRGGKGVVTFSHFYKNYSVAVQGSSDAFFIDPNDNARVRAFLTPSIQSFYEERNGVGTYGQGKHLIFFTTNQMVEPKYIPVFLNDALKVFELFKAASRLSPIPEQTLNEWLKATERMQSLRVKFAFGVSLVVMIPFLTSITVLLMFAARNALLNGLLAAFVCWLITQPISVLIFARYTKRR